MDSKKTRNKSGRWIFFIVHLSALSLSPIYAEIIYAGSIWKTKEYDFSPIGEMLSGYFILAKNIILAICAVSIAWACFKIFFGTQDEIEKAKNQIKYSVMALAAFYLLPYFIRIGIDLGRTYAWKPPQ